MAGVDHIPTHDDLLMKQCPNCGAEQVKRQITAPAFRLAGAGWYETDFKKDGDKKRNLAETASSGAASCEAPSGACGTPACPAAD